jgi:molybdopterin-binding protein
MKYKTFLVEVVAGEVVAGEVTADVTIPVAAGVVAN